MNYYLSIGRLTRQKNYSFLIDCFHELIKKDDKIKLVIIGEGELKENLEKKIKKLKLNQNIFLIGYQKNVFKYLKNAKAFVLSSLWEDPGFVLIEAAFCNLSIISSNCPNGPSELLNGGKDGFMYQSNNKLDFLSKFNEYLLEDKNQLLLKKIAVKKNSRDFTYFKHNIELSKIL
jgi:glycosyltransferase involved in cell wall biosynthesis